MSVKKKIKVLQVNKMYYPEIGGIEKVVQQISEDLKDDVEIEVLACQTKGIAKKDEINGVPVTKTTSLGVYFSMPVSISFPFVFRKKTKKIDIVHIHLPNPLADLSLLLSGFNGKVVISWHSDIIKQKKILKLIKPLLNKTLKRADKIIVATEGHIEGSDFLKPYKNKCVVIPYGIEKELIPEKECLNLEEKIEKREKILLFVGRLVYYKGVRYLIEAFKDIKNAKLYIVGNGPDREMLEKLVGELGISDKVRFFGTISDNELKKMYKQCDIFVLSSIEKTEAFGLVQIEAMSYGKPVINTRLDSGVPYVSVDGVTGITVEPKNVQELKEAMQKLIDDDELRLAYGENAYQRVFDNYVLEENNKEILNLYENILREK